MCCLVRVISHHMREGQMSNGGMMYLWLAEENLTTRRKICPTTKNTWRHPGLNHGLRGENQSLTSPTLSRSFSIQFSSLWISYPEDFRCRYQVVTAMLPDLSILSKLLTSIDSNSWKSMAVKCSMRTAGLIRVYFNPSHCSLECYVT